MTEAVANGEMTRAQRQARVQQMLEAIDRIEEANQSKLQKHSMQRLEMEMRQDMMRRSRGVRFAVEAPVPRARVSRPE